MQRVARFLQGGAALRRNQVPVRNQISRFLHGVVTPAEVARRCQLANQYRRLLRVEFQFGNQVVVHLLHAARPVVHLVVRLSLVEKESLDDAFLLCDLAHLYNALVHVAAVFVQVLDPPSVALVLRVLNVCLVAVLVEQVNALSANRDVRHRHLDAVREVRDHGAPEDVGDAHLGLAVSHRWCCRVEFSYRLVRMFRRAQHEEARVLHAVLVGDGRLSRHVGLPVGEVDMQVRILRETCHNQGGKQKDDFFHRFVSKVQTRYNNSNYSADGLLR